MAPKSILITGCSEAGIGAALALSLAERGHHVFASARTPSKIPAKLSGLVNVTVLSLDVASPESITDAVRAVVGSGRVDVLVNNAGVGYAMPVLDLDVERAKALRGRIVNVSTCGAVANTPWIATYTSSKAALNLLSETLRLELSPFGVAVLSIMAGTVDSQFHINDPDFAVPQGSRYAPIEEIIAGWASGASKPKGCSAETFAEEVAGDIVGGTDGLLFKEPNAGSMDILSRWAPRAVSDAAMSYSQGLSELSKSNEKV